MTGAETFATPAERAALLSARIHREINAGLTAMAATAGFCASAEANRFYFALNGTKAPVKRSCPFYRLGAELRTIAIGNRGDGQ